VETTGGNPFRDKITEIAVLVHDGNQIVEEFVSLINPERKIPGFISRMTGITDEMVMRAPKFYEIARELVEITRDKIFVAHNASFDYHFVRNEFKALGYDYSRQQLCTYKLSRRLLPGKASYGLGKLCRELNIENHSRHRAAGDAMATARLFDILLEKHPQGFLNGSVIAISKLVNELPDFIQTLPEKTGVYYLYNLTNELIYIGKSKNIRKRVAGHFVSQSSRKAVEMANQIKGVNYEITGSEVAALLLESEEIKKHQPIYNRKQRRHFFNYGLYSFTDENGYLNLRIDKTSNEGYPVATFSNKELGKEFLTNLIVSHNLCQNLCGLFGTSGACFYYSVKQCRGACIGLEQADEYNERVTNAIEKAAMPYPNLLVIDKGRTDDEKFLVLVLSGKIHAMGYALPDQIQAMTPGHIENMLQPASDNRDARLIVNSFVRNKRVERTVPF
ncbi:MAG TPA: exonuclease domain-containing protein, partial [Bacteroidales bacterium]|nr:exonuclease domain-containing protein [Bacteroidales bacterium]